MEKLLRGTAAYKIFCGDIASSRLSHAYMLYFTDAANLRDALKFFAIKFFGAEKGGRDERLVLSEGLPDMKLYPRAGQKLTVNTAAEIVDDSALKPVERDKKLYVISDFDTASTLFQNKLLKVLEEPPRGVYFLLGASSLAPVLNTVLSRVKTLEIPPFTEGQILSALERQGSSPLNSAAAGACGGRLGTAQSMLKEKWFEEAHQAALRFINASSVEKAIKTALEYGDFKYKSELLTEMQRLYFGELKKYAYDGDYKGALKKGAVVYAVESINKAIADVKFNANFSSLLYDFALRVVLENEK